MPSAISEPTVSVVIPTYNRAARLHACLRSVADAEPDAEIVVVDDGSTDHTADVVAAFPRVRYIRQANRGPSAARNTGIRESRGRYIALFDSDDRMLRGARPLIPALLDRRPDVGVVFTNALVTHDDGASETAYDASRPASDKLWAVPHETAPDGARIFAREALLRALVIDRCYVIPSISVIRRSALDACGVFDESLIGYEEWDLFSRLAARYAFAYFDEPSAAIVKHDSNLSGDLEAMVVQGVHIMRKFVDGGLPLDAETHAAATKKLEWLSLDTARHAFAREDYATARTRVAAHIKQWGPSAGALMLWSATWLQPAQVRRLRAWKTRMVHEPVR